MNLKKIFVTLLAFSMLLSACGTKDNTNPDAETPDNNLTDVVPGDDETTDSTTEENNNTSDESTTEGGALDILETVWNNLDEDKKFASFGGNNITGTVVEDAPGNYGVDSPEDVDNALGFPAASIDMIDEAANLIHMMNANTFTMASYHVTDTANLDAAVKAIDDNLSDRQWMCGFPDLLTILTIDDEYIVSIFGAGDLVNAVKDQVIASYPDAVVALDKNLMD